MNNSTLPTDPAVSAAELRRRLLASTPPPAAGATSAASVDGTESTTATVEAPAVSSTPAAQPSTDLLSRLRMPGKSGPIQMPTPRPSTPSIPAIPDPTPTRPPSMRRAPSNTAYGNSYGSLNGMMESEDEPDEHAQSEVRRVRLENKELRKLLQEMKQLLQEASEGEQQWSAKQKTFDESLAAKDKQIEELSVQLGAIEEQIAKGELAPPPPAPKSRTELEEWSDELEKENAKLQQDKKKLEEERRQLREDEESLESQMREMEVSMARERALLARQETELRRLNTEIQHELELMQRGDAALREQMAKFQRRAQDVMVKPGGNNGRR
jgi:hypothetical protein